MKNKFELTIKHKLTILIILFIISYLILQYNWYSYHYRSSVSNYNNFAQNIITQIDNGINYLLAEAERQTREIAYSQNVQDYLTEESAYKKLIKYDNAIDTMNSGVRISENMKVAVLLEPDDSLSYTYSRGIISTDIYNITNNKELIINSYDEDVISKLFLSSYGKMVLFGYVVPIYTALEKNIQKRNHIATCITITSMDYVYNSIAALNLTSGQLFFLLQDDEIMISNDESYISQKIDSIYSDIQQDKIRDEIAYKGKDYIIRYKTIKDYGWTIVAMIPKTAIISDMKPLLLKQGISFIITLIAIMLASLYIINSITIPVKDLIKRLNNIGVEDTELEKMRRSSVEIDIITKYINKMLKRNNEIIEKNNKSQIDLYNAQIHQKQAELLFFESQINPHFLYNTLECIRSISDYYNVQEISEISLAASNIFRYAIKSHEIVPLFKEIECAQNFMAIMSLRFPERFKLKISINKSEYHLNFLKMVLQPILENSIKHGFKEKVNECYISIRGFVKDDFYHIEVIDNGMGLDEKQLAHLNETLNIENSIDHPGGGIGLNNINQRIKLKFGTDSGITIKSRFQYYTKIIIQFPIT